jgi:hypothetical protein
MSLFISNFRREAKPLAAIIAIALLCEGGVRLARPLLSLDILNIRRIPLIAQTLGRSHGPRLLFLGNSLTRQAVDLDLVRQLFRQNRFSVVCDKVYADDTTIPDWYYAFKRYFEGSNAPDYLVLGYVLNQLSDSSTVHPERIAAYFGGLRAASEVFTHDLPALDDRMEYVLAGTLAMFSEKERIRNRVLSLLIPDYRTSAQRLNQFEAAGRPSVGGPYVRLERLLKLCSARRVRMAVIAMPLPDHYEIDRALVATLESHGALFLDMRNVPGVSRDSFPDGYHLGPPGAAVYSRQLVLNLGRELPLAAQTSDLSSR